MKKKTVIFCAGLIGALYARNIGLENVSYFCDNDAAKAGTKYFGKEIISFQELIRMKEQVQVIVALKKGFLKDQILQQLKEQQICVNNIEYETFDTYDGLLDGCRKYGVVLYGTYSWICVAHRILEKEQIYAKCYCIMPGTQKNYSEVNYNLNLEQKTLEEASLIYKDSVFLPALMVDDYRIEQFRLINKFKLSKVSFIDIRRYSFLLDIEYARESISIENSLKAGDISNILLLYHMGNSGSIMFEQILDNHPNILTLPTFLLHYQEFFKDINKLKYTADKKNIAIEICAYMQSGFKISIPDEMFLGTSQTRNLDNEYEKIYIGKSKDKHLCNKNGDFEETLLINPQIFMDCIMVELENLEDEYDEHLLLAIAAAYSNALGKKYTPNQKYWLLIHPHEQDLKCSIYEEFFKHFNDVTIKKVYLIRNPFANWLNLVKIGGLYNLFLNTAQHVAHLFESALGFFLECTKEERESDSVIVIRFEDLKLYGKKVLESLCKWMDIPYDTEFERTTLNGIDIYFPTKNPDGKAIYLTGNLKNNLEKDKKILLNSGYSNFDMFRLELLFYEISNAYGYKDSGIALMDFSDAFLKELYQIKFEFLVKNCCTYQLNINEYDSVVKGVIKKCLKKKSMKKYFYKYIQVDND